MIKLVLLLFTTLIGSVFACETCQEYKDETLKVLTRLNKMGVSKLGCNEKYPNSCRTLDWYIKAIDDGAISFKKPDSFQKPEDAKRRTAFSAFNDGSIFLNPEVDHAVIEEKGLIGLHEVLWKSGTVDHEYKISLMAGTLLDSETTEEQREFFTKKIQTSTGRMQEYSDQNENQLTTKPGGGSIVGGGGDYRSFLIRRKVHKALLGQANNTFDLILMATITSIINGIEIDQDASEIELILATKSTPVTKKIFVPDCPNSDYQACSDQFAKRIEDYFFWTLPFFAPNQSLEFKEVYTHKLKAVFHYPIDIESIPNLDAYNYYRSLYSHFCPTSTSCFDIKRKYE